VKKRNSHIARGFEPLGLRTCYIRFKSRLVNIGIISANVAMEVTEEEEKEELCEKLGGA
jgi:hypothetical protein